MHCDQAQELITARVDSELSAAEQNSLDAHLRNCEFCRRAMTAESQLKQQIKAARREVVAPATLRREIEDAMASRRPVAPGKTDGGFAAWLHLRGWRPAFAVTLIALGVATIFYVGAPRQNIGMAAVESHRKLLSGKTALAHYDNANRLRQELSRAVGNRFAPIALDLSMMNLYPVSGFVQQIGDREVLVTVYQGGGPAITCFTFLGTESDAPESAERFFDAEMKLNFYSFSQDGINAVLHQEGNVICILVSKMTPAEILSLLRAKSAHA